MLNKESYLDLKRQLKCICRKDVEDLAKEMKLNDYDKQLLLDISSCKTRMQTCLEMNISESKYRLDAHNLLTKIYNYKNTH